jgi:hypothetical protein
LPTAALLALLPAAAGVLAYFAVLGSPWLASHPVRRRLAAAAASVAWGAFLVGVTEVLSSFHAVTRGAFVTVWALAVAGLAGRVASHLRARRLRWPRGRPSLAADRLAIVCASVCVGVLLVTLFIAIVAPPNSWDSMVYHLSRVMHWQQRHSVAFYPTDIYRQLSFAPGSEYILLHLHVLTDGDRFDNLMQWVAFGGSLLAVSAVAACLGATPRGQAFAALIAATLPMAIVQATSTQNDVIVGYWILCFALMALALEWRRPEPLQAIVAGAALGLAIFTKATALMFGFPVGVVLLFRIGRSTRVLAGVVGIVAVMALAINGPQFVRNQRVYGSVFGYGIVSNTKFTPGAVASNLIRHTASEAATGSVAVNAALENVTVNLHKALHLNLNDRGVTFAKTRFNLPPDWNTEDSAGAPLHLLVGIIALTLGWTRARRLRPWIAVVVAGYLLAVVVLKWQPWINRLELPAFLLAAPVVGAIATSLRWRRVLAATAMLLSVAAGFVLVGNRFRPLVTNNGWLRTERSLLTTSRTSLYFTKKEYLEARYRMVVKAVSQHDVHRLGLVASYEDFEYPLWIMLRAAMPAMPEIRNVLVTSESGTLDRPVPVDAIVCLHCIDSGRRRIEAGGFRWAGGDDVQVFFPLQPGTVAPG